MAAKALLAQVQQQESALADLSKATKKKDLAKLKAALYADLSTTTEDLTNV